MAQNPINPKKDELSDQIDSPHDREELEKETVDVSIPNVNEIPGQEDFVPAPLGELADTTISSADEEGDDIYEENIDEEILESEDSNVSQTEKDDLRKSANDMPGDDQNLRRAALDNTDDDGTPLNEESFKTNVTGTDLDVPGAQQDDANEKIGEEDEQNNEYSIAGTEDPPQDDF
jgi:hypothetical protein